MNRRCFMASLGTVPVLAAQRSANRPNILIILVDDMRFDQMTHMGHPYIQTPNLDRLAREGARFTNAYVPTPLCGPVRASLVTGQMASVHGRLDNEVYPPTLSPYLPVSFREQGYRTAMLGKFYEGRAVEDVVQHKAYDFWFKNNGPDFSGLPKDASAKERSKYYKAHLYYDQVYEVGDKKQVVPGHQTDVLFEQAAGFATAQTEQPFLIFMSPFAPHAPFNPTLRRKGKYAGRGIPLNDNVEFGVGYMTPKRTEYLNEVHERTCEMVEDLDEGVGRVLQALENSGQLENSIIIFTSDNGVIFGEHGFGWKRHPWQESIKVPMLVRYPKAIRPGTVCKATVSLADLFPTCAELAGIKLPLDKMRYGTSWGPLLRREKKQIRDATLIMQYDPGVKGQPDFKPELAWCSLISSSGWKLICYRVGPPEDMRPDYGKTFLFNLNDDPLEMRNLAAHPEYKTVLKKMMARLAKELDAQREPAKWLKEKL